MPEEVDQSIIDLKNGEEIVILPEVIAAFFSHV